jgi:FkbM family methyltransferase
MWPAAMKCLIAYKFKLGETTVRRNGIAMKVGTDRGKGMWCAVSGVEFEPELRWAINHLKRDGVFIDVGANVGAFTLHCAKKVGPGGRVISFEPGDGAFEKLKGNVEANHLEGTISLLKAGAGDKDCTMVLAGNHEAWFTLHLSADGEGPKVEVRSIDSVVRERGLTRVDLIKVDAEGFEPQVFQGAAETIRRFKPAIIFESINLNSCESARDIMKENGYRIMMLRDSKLVEAYEDGATTNLIALV